LFHVEHFSAEGRVKSRIPEGNDGKKSNGNRRSFDSLRPRSLRMTILDFVQKERALAESLRAFWGKERRAESGRR